MALRGPSARLAPAARASMLPAVGTNPAHGPRSCHARRLVPRAGSFTGTLFAALWPAIPPPHRRCPATRWPRGSRAPSGRWFAGPAQRSKKFARVYKRVLRHTGISALGLPALDTARAGPAVAPGRNPDPFIFCAQARLRPSGLAAHFASTVFDIRPAVAAHSCAASSSAPWGCLLRPAGPAARGFPAGAHPRSPRCALVRATRPTTSLLWKQRCKTATPPPARKFRAPLTLSTVSPPHALHPRSMPVRVFA